MASEPTGTQAIDRAAQLLCSVVEAVHPPSVGELAARAGLPKSTTSRLIGALERQGLVQRLGERGRLHPGPVLLRFATGDSSSALLELAAPSLRRLAESSGETVNLAIPGPLGVEHLAQEDTAHIVGVANWVGRRVPLHVAANGKVFLAYGAPLLAPLDRLTPRTIVDPARLDAELARVRARGYATSIDELEHGLSALAAPVFGHRVPGQGGDAFAALSISGPSARLTSERITSLAPLLVEESNKLAQRLGHREHARGAA
jgi:DNA-binding IclR family transcriptional regulator